MAMHGRAETARPGRADFHLGTEPSSNLFLVCSKVNMLSNGSEMNCAPAVSRMIRRHAAGCPRTSSAFRRTRAELPANGTICVAALSSVCRSPCRRTSRHPPIAEAKSDPITLVTMPRKQGSRFPGTLFQQCLHLNNDSAPFERVVRLVLGIRLEMRAHVV